MKKCFFYILSLCFSTVSLAQINEIGVFLGGTNYVGDVGSTKYIYPNNIGVGVIYKWNWNPRIAVRGTISYLTISRNDLKSNNIVRQNRGYSFSNIIKEVAAGLEYSFFEYDLSSDDKYGTPYILLELAIFNYKRVKSQTAPGKFTYTDKTSYAIPFGIGYKQRLIDNLAFAIEAKARYTFIDDLDYTTKNFSSLNFEGQGNDWYFFTGFSLVYTFGRPACYTTPQ
jgi:hypothetical protein